MSGSEPLDLRTVEARLDAATRGPWVTRESPVGHWYVMADLEGEPVSIYRVAEVASAATLMEHERGYADSNAAFIAAAPADISALLVALRETRAALKEAKGVVGWFAMQREKESSKWYIELEERIAAVLAGVKDE